MNPIPVSNKTLSLCLINFNGKEVLAPEPFFSIGGSCGVTSTGDYQ
jgi:hypothetical protein